ncbi:MAG: Ig-like domain-containing protein [Muribaculaceae bacterium]|nr:Ig-like domain-containing protein [Muribaculaceae bacterium]
MARLKGTGFGMRLLAWGAISSLLAACASMGRPEGGARDENPPVFVRSDPAPGAVNTTPKRINVIFDENIQLEDAFSKVVVSPAQKTPPTISSNGRRLTVDFRDTLMSNTTYTIDFADAIKDLNEGNILDGFAMDFSTGPTLDTLRISGMVLQAENLEPAQGMLVGVYSNLSDTAIHTLPFERIARTNQYGQFTIRNLKEGEYRIFALNDLNRDYHWDRSEDIAFYDFTVRPYTEAIEVTDTLYASDGSDSLFVRQGTRYLPNDILLSWFNENYKSAYLSDYKRPDARRITLTFGAPADSLPKITIVDGAGTPGADISEWARLKANSTLDTLEYWIADTTIVQSDSLRLSVGYFRTDTTDQLTWKADTLRFNFRDPDKKKKEKEKKKKKDERPAFIVDSISGDTTFLPPADMEYLTLRTLSQTQDLNKPLILEASLPLENLDSAGVHVEMLIDTVWTELDVKFRPDSSDMLMRRRFDIDWEPGAKYRLKVDTLAAMSIYNVWNRPFSQEFTAKQTEDYSKLIFTLPGLDSIQAVVQLLSSSDAPVYQAVKAPGATTVELPYLNPGTYYARLIIDANRNGKWDTGSVRDSIQPEEVYYFAKKFELKKNWDVEQTWNIYELPVDAQKPYAIKKNKPKLKRGEKAPGEEEEEDEFGGGYDPFGGTGGINTGGNRGGFGSGGRRPMR